MTKSIPKKNKCKKAKWWSEEALQIDEKRREAKGKRERKRYTQLNTGFQRTAKRGKNVFLSEQCKGIEQNNRKGKTKDCFKKIGDTKRIFLARMGTKKKKWQGPSRSRRDKKRWQEYIEELYKKDLNDLDNHDGVVTHLESDILECQGGLRKHYFEQSYWR